MQAAQRVGIRADLLIDMQGPEIRIGGLQKPLQLEESQEAVFVIEHMEQRKDGVIPVAEHVFSALEPGSHVLLDDGSWSLQLLRRGNRCVPKCCGEALCMRERA